MPRLPSRSAYGRWASMKSFCPKDGAGSRPHQAATASATSRARSARTRPCLDHRRGRPAVPQGRRRGQPALLHRPRADGNRNGLAVGGVLTRAAGTAEAAAALHLAQGLPPGPQTLGADKGYDNRDLVMQLRELGVTPHVAQNAYATERATHTSLTFVQQLLVGQSSEPVSGGRGGPRLTATELPVSTLSVWRAMLPVPSAILARQ